MIDRAQQKQELVELENRFFILAEQHPAEALETMEATVREAGFQSLYCFQDYLLNITSAQQLIGPSAALLMYPRPDVQNIGDLERLNNTIIEAHRKFVEKYGDRERQRGNPRG